LLKTGDELLFSFGYCKKKVDDTKRGNQNPYIEDVLTTQWSKDKGQNNKWTINALQNIAHKTTDRATQTPSKIGGEPRCSGRVSTIYKTLHIKPQIEQHKLLQKSGENPGAPKGKQFLLYKGRVR